VQLGKDGKIIQHKPIIFFKSEPIQNEGKNPWYDVFNNIDCYTEFSIKYFNIDYYSKAERASNLMKQDFKEKERLSVSSSS